MTPSGYKSWLAAQMSAIAQQTKQLGRLRAALTRQGVLARNASR
jgi:hypothetical protein